MNLLPCAVEGRLVRLPGGHAEPLPRAYPGLEQPEGRHIELGIRPEFATILPGKVQGGVPVRLRRVEDLDRRSIARA